MTVEDIVSGIIRDGQLTPRQEAALNDALRSTSADPSAIPAALTRLKTEMLEGRILVAGRKCCANVMEELVWAAVLEEFAALEPLDSESMPDLGDVAAYALNRLSPLYATTEDGAAHQRARASKKMGAEIRSRTREAMEQSLRRPDHEPDRAPLGRWFGKDFALTSMSKWLQSVPGME